MPEGTGMAAREKVYWEDETRFEENKEVGHATYMPYPSEKDMLADKAFYDRPWEEVHNSAYMLLNGTWAFHWVSEPSQRPLDFIRKISMYRDGTAFLCRLTGKCRAMTVRFMPM